MSEREKRIAREAFDREYLHVGSNAMDKVYAAVEAVLAEREKALKVPPGVDLQLVCGCVNACVGHDDMQCTPAPATCPHCGPNCLGGAAHNARAEDGVVYAPEQPARLPRGIPAPYFEEDEEVEQPAAASDVAVEMLEAFLKTGMSVITSWESGLVAMTAALQVANKAWEKAIREEWDVCESQSDIDLGEYPDFIKRLQSRMGSAKC